MTLNFVCRWKFCKGADGKPLAKPPAKKVINPSTGTLRVTKGETTKTHGKIIVQLVCRVPNCGKTLGSAAARLQHERSHKGIDLAKVIEDYNTAQRVLVLLSDSVC